jgi:di/tricarboxylate transporter
MMLAPSLRLMPKRPAEPEMKEESEAASFEPLRVLLPRVTSGIGGVGGRFGVVLGIAYSASLGGMATVMGAASNAVASGFLSEIRPWTFIDWMKYGLPAFLLIFPMTWLLPSPVERLDVKQAQV